MRLVYRFARSVTLVQLSAVHRLSLHLCGIQQARSFTHFLHNCFSFPSDQDNEEDALSFEPIRSLDGTSAHHSQSLKTNAQLSSIGNVPKLIASKEQVKNFPLATNFGPNRIKCFGGRKERAPDNLMES